MAESANATVTLECGIKFLEQYPEFTEFAMNKSSYRFDMHALIVEAKRLDLKAAIEDIQSEFDANGTSSELYDADQSDLEHSQLMSPVLCNQLDADTAEIDEPLNESSECDVFRDITNQLKRYKLRSNKSKSRSCMRHCVFCLNNGADKEVYESHNCKDRNGNVTCPVLRKFVCSRCHATGSKAHTAKYCPLKPIITPEDCLAMEQRWLQKRCRAGGPGAKTNGMDEQSKTSTKTTSRSRLRL